MSIGVMGTTKTGWHRTHLARAFFDVVAGCAIVWPSFPLYAIAYIRRRNALFFRKRRKLGLRY